MGFLYFGSLGKGLYVIHGTDHPGSGSLRQEYPIQASTEFTSEHLFLSFDFFSLKFYIEVDYFVY